MNELLLCEWVRAAAPEGQTNFIVRSVAPLVRDARFEHSTHGYFVSRHGDKLEEAEVCLRVFAEDSNDSALRALVDAHTGGSMQFTTSYRADPMLAPELEWYRRALTLVTNVAIEVLESSSFRLSSALLSERDIFSKVGRSIIAKVLNKHSKTYRSLSPEESRLFWSELKTKSGDTVLPCRPGHWLWNLLAY